MNKYLQKFWFFSVVVMSHHHWWMNWPSNGASDHCYKHRIVNEDKIVFVSRRCIRKIFLTPNWWLSTTLSAVHLVPPISAVSVTSSWCTLQLVYPANDRALDASLDMDCWICCQSFQIDSSNFFFLLLLLFLMFSFELFFFFFFVNMWINTTTIITKVKKTGISLNLVRFNIQFNR